MIWIFNMLCGIILINHLLDTFNCLQFKENVSISQAQQLLSNETTLYLAGGVFFGKSAVSLRLASSNSNLNTLIESSAFTTLSHIFQRCFLITNSRHQFKTVRALVQVYPISSLRAMCTFHTTNFTIRPGPDWQNPILLDPILPTCGSSFLSTLSRQLSLIAQSFCFGLLTPTAVFPLETRVQPDTPKRGLAPT